MIKASTIAIVFVFLFSTTKAQILPGLTANFGIEGDVLSGVRQNGTFSPSGTHDWFYKTGVNPGKGVIDTTGKANILSKLTAGENIGATRGMSLPLYSVQDGALLFDSRYIRDQLGMGGSTTDRTSYQGGQKNGDNPVSWATNPTGAPVADKADLVDGYVHFRRNGSIINGINSSHLVAVFGMSTLANTGDRFFDIEFYRSRIAYDSTTGAFSNPGPAATGGHSVWQFNADGSLKNFGDMTITFSFNSATVSEIAVWLWVSRTDYENLNPRDFDFVPGELNGATNNATYGYVKIKPNTGSNSPAWGATNLLNTDAPIWGTANKENGGNANLYHHFEYANGQFAEGGIDLSSIGIDPAYTVGGEICAPVFTRVIFKSRASSSFTSALKDFMGPFEFLDAPVPPAEITPATLKCNALSATLSPVKEIFGANYVWSTTNGHIIGNSTGPSITVDQAGKYYLTASMITGCPTAIDSVTVETDFFQPVASASVSGLLNNQVIGSTVQVLGGNEAASNYNTPFGGSAGLSWNWSGPLGYSSTTKNSAVALTGLYKLVVTEIRNGCKDTAEVVVLSNVLPVKLVTFTAVKKEKEKVLLSWSTEDELPLQMELLKSYNGVDFTSVTTKVPVNSNLHQDYQYLDNVSNRIAEKIYYKIRITEQTGATRYTPVIYVSFTGSESLLKFAMSPSPASSYTTLTILNTNSTGAVIQIADQAGKIVFNKSIQLEKGVNQVRVDEVQKLVNGIYIVRLVSSNGEVFSKQLMKL